MRLRQGDVADRRCQVAQMVTTARCEAAGPWGMQGMIEDIMATQASQTLEAFLLFCKQRCLMGVPELEVRAAIVSQGFALRRRHVCIRWHRSALLALGMPNAG